MKVPEKILIPNTVVYATLYLIIFGISIWLLTNHSESQTNWLLYVAMIGSVLAGLIKLAVYSRTRQRST